MKSIYKGSCLCGQVTFEASEFSQKAAACHCTMCRKFHGAPFAVLVQVGYFQYLTGADSIREFTGSNETVRTFCERCGSSIGFRAAGACENEFEVAVACFDEEIPVKIDAHVFTAYKASWYEPDNNIPAYAEGREQLI